MRGHAGCGTSGHDPKESANDLRRRRVATYFGGLSPDLVHPADNAMIEMGENLAKRLAPLVRNA